MGGPLNETFVHKSPGCVFRVDLHEHVGVGIVAGGRHHDVFRAVGGAIVDPLVFMARDNKLYGVFVSYEQRVQAVVLIIQGLNMAATQAAADVLFHSLDIGRILDRAKLPDGAIRPFELLVQTSSIGATAPDARIIATRFYN